MLKNANLLVKIGADTAENEQHVAEISTGFRDVTFQGPSRAARPGAPPGSGCRLEIKES